MKKLSFDRRTASRVLAGLKHYRLALLVSLLLAAAVVALTLYIPLLTGDAIDGSYPSCIRPSPYRQTAFVRR